MNFSLWNLEAWAKDAQPYHRVHLGLLCRKVFCPGHNALTNAGAKYSFTLYSIMHKSKTNKQLKKCNLGSNTGIWPLFQFSAAVETEVVCWLQSRLLETIPSVCWFQKLKISPLFFQSALAQSGVNGGRCWLQPSTSLSWLTSWKWWMSRPASWWRSWRGRQGMVRSTVLATSLSVPLTSFVVGEINADVCPFVQACMRVRRCFKEDSLFLWEWDYIIRIFVCAETAMGKKIYAQSNSDSEYVKSVYK